MSDELTIIVEPAAEILEITDKGPQGPPSVTGIAFYKAGRPLGGEVLNRHLSIGRTPLDATCAGVALEVAPTSAWIMLLKVGDVTVGSAEVAPGDLFGPFEFEPGFEGPNDLEVLEFVAPETQDATAGGVTVNMQTPLEA